MTNNSKKYYSVSEILQPEDITSALKQAAFFLAGATLLSAIIFSVTRDWSWLIFCRNTAIGLVACLILIYLTQKGKIQLAAYATLLWFGLWLLSIAWNGAGVRGVTYTMLVFVIVGAGLFIGKQAGYTTALLITLSGVGLLFAGRAGLLVNINRPISDVAALINTTITFFVVAHLVRLSVDQVERALNKATREIEERSQAEEEVRRLNRELEGRVAKRTEELVASNERYHNFIKNSVEGIWLMAFDEPISLDLPPEEQARLLIKQGYIAECNDALARMYGFASREEMIGKRLLEHMFGGKVSETNTHSNINLAREGFQAYGFPTDEVNEHGEHIYFLNNAVGEIKDNHLVGLWGVQRDITERKQLEAERERFIVELERKNSELERFTYTVSHDLKAPLVTIRGFLGLLEKDVLSANPERIKTDIERITDSTDKMQILLNDLLELSRAGRLVNTPESIPFETVAKDAVNLVAGHIAAKGVHIEIAPNLPTVYGDPNRLVQVMQNLIDNAVKFMGEQKDPRIMIGAQVSDADDTPVLFVRDNGIGIEAQEQELVFGLFDKLDSSIEGTGIGLALVKRIIEVHGGKIWVESKGVGKGSTFYFTIPGSHK